MAGIPPLAGTGIPPVRTPSQAGTGTLPWLGPPQQGPPPLAGTGTPLAGTGTPPWLGLGPPPGLGPPWLEPPPPAGTGTPPGWNWDPPLAGTGNPPWLGLGSPPVAEKLRLWRTNKCLLKLQYTCHFLITFLASFSLIVTVTNFTNLCTLTSEIYCKMSGIYHYLLIYFHLALGINC